MVPRSSGSRPRVTVVIVNYNGRVHVDECLSSVRRQTFRDFESVFVDNGSTDGSLEYVASAYPEVRRIATGANLGYSGGINRALALAQGTYVAVLNVDTVVEPTWLEALVAVMDRSPTIGAVTSRVVLYHDRTRLNALGLRIHVSGLAFNEGLGKVNRLSDVAPFPVSGVHGCAFLVRREILDQLGGMNEATFMYYEEVDLSWMLHLLGWELWCVPDSVVYHKYTLKMHAEKFFALERNRLALLAVTLEPWTVVRLLPHLGITEALTWGYALVHGPQYLGAKGRAWGWVIAHRGELRARRRSVQRMRRVPDHAIIPKLGRGYAWDQLAAILRPRQP